MSGPLILNPKDRNDRVVQEHVLKAAVIDAVRNGAPIPFYNVSPDYIERPPSMPFEVAGKVHRWIMAATLRPVFKGEADDTVIYLPTYRRHRQTGIAEPLDVPGLRPFCAALVKMPFTAGDLEVIGEIPMRSDLASVEFAPDRFVEVTRVPREPWMFLTPQKHGKDLQALMQQQIDAADADVLAAYELGEPLDLANNHRFIEACQSALVDELRAEECPDEKCNRGILGQHRGQEVHCNACYEIGRYWPSSSQEASTSPTGSEASDETSSD